MRTGSSSIALQGCAYESRTRGGRALLFQSAGTDGVFCARQGGERRLGQGLDIFVIRHSRVKLNEAGRDFHIYADILLFLMSARGL